MISLRIPEDVLEDLKLVAPRLGFSGYQPLIRAYIGQGLRVDLARLEEETDLMQLIESLRKHGVKDDIIASAMADKASVGVNYLLNTPKINAKTPSRQDAEE
jgi:hypothetical protein